MPSPRLCCRLPACSVAALCLLVACSDDESGGTTMLVFSDPHYMSPSLGTSGPALDSYSSQDRKLLAESDAVFRALVDRVAAEKPAIVLIPGDLTKDGELVSHQGVAVYLAQMEAAGASVYVIPGNHDVLNPGASSYSGTTTAPVPNVTREQFAEIYDSFGYSEAKERDPAGTLSYLAEPRPGLWILALDTCIYEPGSTAMTISGRLAAGTLQWVTAKLAEARQQGVTVIGMQHHGVVEHFRGQQQLFPEYLVSDFATLGPQLADAGLHVMLTGHFHANDVTATTAGSTGSLFDVETGSAVTAPAAYRVMQLHGKRLSIATQTLQQIDYDTGGKDFQTYAHDQLQDGLAGTVAALIEAPPYQMASADAEALAPMLAEGLVGHYAGDETITPDQAQAAGQLRASSDPNKKLAGDMLFSIHVDLQPPDLSLTIDLGVGAVAQ